MKTMKSTLALLTILTILFATNCKKPNDGVNNNTPGTDNPIIANDAARVNATITGSVLDENNKPVANAVVKSGSEITTTDALGNFIFKNISVSAANGSVTVIKTGYFNGIRSFVTSAGKTNYVKIQLLKQTLSATVNAASGGMVNVSNGATIQFPAGAFVTSTGTAYTGNVKIYTAYIDPTAPNLPLVVPGDLRGLNATGGEYLLKSYGMVGAELKDENGNALKIATGKTATISFPIPTSLQASAPASIPLWHFDEATARWKEEGAATKNGNAYTASVSKFSFWNVDVPISNFINLELRLVNSATNNALANTMVKITSVSTNAIAYDYTNDSGYVSGYVPKNENLKLEVIVNPLCIGNNVVYTQNIGPYTSNTNLGNINVTLPASSYVNFSGNVKGCNNMPISNGYVSIAIENGNGAMVNVDAQGNFNTTILHCGGGTINYKYNAVDLGGSAYGNPQTGATTTNTVTLANIVACGNTINTNGVYIGGNIENNAVIWKDGVPSYITNFSSNSDLFAAVIKVSVIGNDVHAIVVSSKGDGSGATDSLYVKHWINGTTTTVYTSKYETGGSIPTLGAAISDIGDIYYIIQNSDYTAAAIWKNNAVYQVLPMNGLSGRVYIPKIKLYGNDIYAVNEPLDEVKKTAYWKNGNINLINDSTFGAYDIAVNNSNNVYVLGESNSRACYYLNNQKLFVPLTNGYTKSGIYSSFFINSDIYFGGYLGNFNNNYGQNLAATWKNGTATVLTNVNTTFEQFDVIKELVYKNNILYAIGSTFDEGIYFQNNQKMPLDGVVVGDDYFLYSIFVK
jgi:hypothetical protein